MLWGVGACDLDQTSARLKIPPQCHRCMVREPPQQPGREPSPEPPGCTKRVSASTSNTDRAEQEVLRSVLPHALDAALGCGLSLRIPERAVRTRRQQPRQRTPGGQSPSSIDPPSDPQIGVFCDHRGGLGPRAHPPPQAPELTHRFPSCSIRREVDENQIQTLPRRVTRNEA